VEHSPPGKKATVSNPASPAPTPTANHLVARYEELRSQAMGACGRGLGLALRLRQGMRACLEAWSCTLTMPAERHLEDGMDEAVPVQLRAEIAIVLAGMALSSTEVER
jgi:hypothetical protein